GGGEGVGRGADARHAASGAAGPGGCADLASVLEARPVDQVILALAQEDYARLPGLLDAVGDEPVTIHVVPDLFRFTSLRGGVEEFEGMPFIHLRDSPLHGWNQVAKRVFDIVFSLTVLIGLSPLLALIAASVKLSSPRPLFYRQERIRPAGH